MKLACRNAATQENICSVPIPFLLVQAVNLQKAWLGCSPCGSGSELGKALRTGGGNSAAGSVFQVLVVPAKFAPCLFFPKESNSHFTDTDLFKISLSLCHLAKCEFPSDCNRNSKSTSKTTTIHRIIESENLRIIEWPGLKKTSKII